MKEALLPAMLLIMMASCGSSNTQTPTVLMACCGTIQQIDPENSNLLSYCTFPEVNYSVPPSSCVGKTLFPDSNDCLNYNGYGIAPTNLGACT